MEPLPSAPALLLASPPAPPPAPPPSPSPGSGTAALAPPLGTPSAMPVQPIAAGIFLVLLAAVALLAARRRRRVPRLVEIVETASVGPKRSLVVARMGGEVLLLGSSEGGITLLASRPDAPRDAVSPLPVTPSLSLLKPSPSPLTPALSPEAETAGEKGLLFRLRRAASPSAAGPAPTPSFDALLAESLEDVELRRKLAAGESGSVR
jgi:flagellar biogenesis protein FliO